MATLLLVLILLSNFAIPGIGGDVESKALKDSNTTTAPVTVPAPTTNDNTDNNQE